MNAVCDIYPAAVERWSVALVIQVGALLTPSFIFVNLSLRVALC